MTKRRFVPIAIALALAGCGGSAEPRPEETPAPASSPTFAAEPIAPLAVDAPAGDAPPIAPPETAPAAAPVASSVRLVYATVASGPLATASVLAPLRIEVIAARDEDSIPGSLGALGPSFEVLDGTPILLANGSIVTLGGESLLPGRKETVTAFAREASGGLVLTCGKSLGVLSARGWKELVELPGEGYSVTAGDDGALYLHRPQDEHGAIFIVKDLRSAKLVEAPAPVSAVAASGRRIFFAVEHAIYTVAPGDAAKIIFDLPSFRAGSLAYDANRSVLYASDGKSVLAIVNGTAFPIATGLRGELRLVKHGSGQGLYVLDPARRVLVRVTGLDALALRRE